MTRSRTALITVAVLVGSLAHGPSHAALPPDHPGWIRQGGNGSAGSIPQAGEALAEILYRPDRFDVADTGIPPSSDSWRGWGSIEQPSGQSRLFMVQGGMGATWSAPQPATIRDPDGNDVPFLLGDTVHFAVQFQNVRQDWPAYFIVYWNGTDPKALGSNLNGGQAILGTHLAVSENGVEWFDDQIINNHAIGPAITGVSGFNAGMVGATQLLLDPRKPYCTDSPTATFPFDCPIAIVFTAISPSGVTSIAAAGADRYDLLGTTFRGRASPLLSPGGTTWDTGSVDLAKTRKRNEPFGTGYEMTYAGGLSTGGCTAATTCSIGVASSSDRLTWTKNNPARAATEPKLYERFLGPVTLGPAMFAFDGNPEGHARGFIAVHDGSPDGSTWYALTHPTPKTGPTLEVSKPDNGFYNESSAEIDLFANDDRGANPGLDGSSITLEIDHIPVHELGISWGYSPTIVGSFHYLGLRIKAPKVEIGLADGEHWLEAHILDLDGEHEQLITHFVIDTTDPDTTITSATQNGALAPYVATSAPLGSAIHLEGEALDNFSGVQRLTAVVQNVLGQYQTLDSLGPNSGFYVNMLTPRRAAWTWDAPLDSTVLMVPGPIRISILARDPAGNIEQPTPANTVDILVI